MLGSVTWRQTCQPRAPRLTAAISSSGPIASSNGMSSRAITGNVTNAVARTSPGVAKTILMPWSRSHGPKKPWRPKSSRSRSPTTTGETVNGRSIIDVSSARPGNRKRPMAQAAASPKTRLSATAIGATVRVKRMACRVSGSPKRFCRYTRGHAASDWAKTFTSRTPTSRMITASAAAISRRRTHAGSSWGRRSSMTGPPALEQVDDEQAREGDAEQHHRDRRRLGVGELLQACDDQHRRDLGLVRHVARDEDERPVLAERAGKGERKAGHHRGHDGREDHAPGSLESIRSQARRRLLHVLLETLQHRLQRADDEGEADEGEYEHDPETRVRPLDAEGNEEAPVPPGGNEQARVDEPGHRGRQ